MRPLYLPTLDGWRAIAILLVLCNHDGLHRLGRFSTAWFTSHGGYGVDLFFAISGFLICTLLLDEEHRTGAIDRRAFYTRRIFRILPAALSFLLVVALLRFAGLITAVHLREWLGALFFFRNVLPMGPGTWYTDHFWSLSVEEHFYLLLPSLLILWRPRRRALLLAITGILILVGGVFLARRFNPILFSDYKLGSIFLAAAAAVALREPSIRQLAMRSLQPFLTVAIAIAVMLWVPGLAALLLLPFFFLAAIVSTTLHPSSVLSKLLESPLLRFIGKRSYSLYLWQQLFLTAHFGPFDFILQRWPLSILCSFACACLSYSLIEQPLRRIGHTLAQTSITLPCHPEEQSDVRTCCSLSWRPKNAENIPHP